MPVGIQILLAFIVGSLLGLLIGWLMGRGKSLPPDARLEGELRQQLSQRETELNQARSEVVQNKTSLATAQANQAAAEKLLGEQRALHERALAEARDAQMMALEHLRTEFRGLSAEALKQSAPEFLRLANETFGKFQEAAKGDLEKRHESIKVLVEPLKQQLETYQRRLQQSETTQSGVLGEVKKQLDTLAQQSLSLASETQQFRMVLHSSQARGRWGEETLRRVVEAAGMSAHCDFSEQSQSGDAKPDLVVRLPGDRMIIVDAKVPDLDFLNAVDGAEPAKRAESLAAHASKLKGAIKLLADKDYPAQFPNALDYVVLFLPAESLFSAALEGDQELIVWAANRKILLATPASLIALLRSVSVSWQQHAQTENAKEIAAAAQDLFTRVLTFTKHLEGIRGGLEAANKAYNQAVGSCESRVRPAGEKLLKFGGVTAELPFPDLPQLELTLRSPPKKSEAT
jgi:DNA recombination protein RmuC